MLSNTAKYLIIGDGQTARHMQFYFQSLNINVLQWARAFGNPLEPLLQQASHVLLLISDDAIESFIQQYPSLSKKQLVHFSGALVTSYAHSAHPLISFSQALFDPSFYPSIPFFIEAEGPSLAELLPDLPNPHWSISRSQKALYHSLAVLSGNFTTLLWQKLFKDLQEKFNIPKESAYPYLQSIAYNLQQDNNSALTGPLARGDKATLALNLKALEGDDFAHVFQAFIDFYNKTKK